MWAAGRAGTEAFLVPHSTVKVEDPPRPALLRESCGPSWPPLSPHVVLVLVLVLVLVAVAVAVALSHMRLLLPLGSAAEANYLHTTTPSLVRYVSLV